MLTGLPGPRSDMLSTETLVDCVLLFRFMAVAGYDMTNLRLPATSLLQGAGRCACRGQRRSQLPPRLGTFWLKDLPATDGNFNALILKLHSRAHSVSRIYYPSLQCSETSQDELTARFPP
jgi:hypothetical protein